MALQSFLGLTGWYFKFIPKFIPCYACVVEPLHALLHAFSRVKELIATSPAWMLLDPALPALVTADACNNRRRSPHSAAR